jgi:hypothetical protein
LWAAIVDEMGDLVKSRSRRTKQQRRLVPHRQIASIHRKLSGLDGKFNILSPISNIDQPQLPSIGFFSTHAEEWIQAN